MIELFIYVFFLVLIIACVSLRQVNEQNISDAPTKGLF